MFTKNADAAILTAWEGVHYKNLGRGKNTSIHEFRLDKGIVVPTHSHPHEQTGYLVSGRMYFVVEGQKVLVQTGDGWCIPGDAAHGVEVLEDCFVIEVFSPAREEYLR
jgi:quercetin dioxygenase-like cupin family protein